MCCSYFQSDNTFLLSAGLKYSFISCCDCSTNFLFKLYVLLEIITIVIVLSSCS